MDFYSLPKINITEETKDNFKGIQTSYIKIPNTSDLKLTSIVTGPASNTQRTRRLIGIILNRYVNVFIALIAMI